MEFHWHRHLPSTVSELQWPSSMAAHTVELSTSRQSCRECFRLYSAFALRHSDLPTSWIAGKHCFALLVHLDPRIVLMKARASPYTSRASRSVLVESFPSGSTSLSARLSLESSRSISGPEAAGDPQAPHLKQTAIWTRGRLRSRRKGRARTRTWPRWSPLGSLSTTGPRVSDNCNAYSCHPPLCRFPVPRPE